MLRALQTSEVATVAEGASRQGCGADTGSLALPPLQGGREEDRQSCLGDAAPPHPWEMGSGSFPNGEHAGVLPHTPGMAPALGTLALRASSRGCSSVSTK